MRAKARHILVDDKLACLELKKKIDGGAEFADVARAHSQCPSGKQGGELGEFGPGEMVPEFDKIVFNEAIGDVHGPIRTDFGYHLIQITSRQ